MIISFGVKQSNNNDGNDDYTWPTPSPVAPYHPRLCNGKRTGGTPGWKDSTGDSCKWYETYEWSDACSENRYTGAMGPASEHCCYCLVAAVPSPRPTRTPIVPICTGSTPNWKDDAGYGCDFYERHDEPGCPHYGDLSGSSGTAKENCCYCMSSSTSDQPSTSPIRSTPYPISSCNGKTGGMPGWQDINGSGCNFYEKHPRYCSDVFNNGNAMGSPMDNCCACMIEASAPPSVSPLQSTPTVSSSKPNQDSILLE